MQALRAIREAKGSSRVAVTLIELLCVMGIIAILLGLYLPTIIRVYKRIRVFLGDM